MSRAASAQYGVPCPTCKAGQDDPCRTLTTGRVTDTHVSRIEMRATVHAVRVAYAHHLGLR